MITAFVLIQTDAARIPESAQAISEIEGISEVYSVTGSYDLVAMVRLSDFERLADVVPEKLAQVPGISRTETMVAFRCYSNYDLDRMWSLGFEE